MEAVMRYILLVLTAVLLASCGSLEIPGETNAQVETIRAAMNGIRSTEKQIYLCDASALAVISTRIKPMFGFEHIEEWDVSSCTGEVHTYIVSYISEEAQTLVYHERDEENGTSTNMLWTGGGYIKNNYIAKETIRTFDREVGAIRLRVLNESSETEAMLQKGKGVQYEGKHRLSLCETPLLKFKAMRIESVVDAASNGLLNNRFSAVHCYQWYGTRRDWKEKILLKQGV